ncbi:MAG: nitrite/sulfite reductase [Acidobacteria bacterium]|nr:nitrite/sulfite reductase [Acidobacteriota bacterium]
MSEQSAAVSAKQAERWQHLPRAVREEIDIYETELRRVQQGQMPEKVFLEFRLRHGVYGQRQAGVQMQRIKIPLGMLTTRQMEQLANLSEEYSDGISHITTRQDIQFHFMDINDTPNLMRRLAEVGITTREACGNAVRNVTACPQSGVCSDETFDVTPYARAMAYFLLRHPDAQNFGRKFKIAFSGCRQHACGLAIIHDIGAIAAVREEGGKLHRGFQVYLGGGLGAIPHQAKLYSDFVPAEEMLPLAQAISRVFARLGEKKNRAKARMKFLVAKLGMDEFAALIREERQKLPPDPRWTAYLSEAGADQEKPLKPASSMKLEGVSDEFQKWVRMNVRPQAQEGYSMVTVFLPLGDITARQLHSLAGVCRKYVNDTIRTTVDQNLLIRWVPSGDLPALHQDLAALDLAQPGAEGMANVTACPGTDSCKLGITSSRGLAAVLHRDFQNGMGDLAERKDIRIKISGCFNACGQHHIANIGFFGSSRRKGQHVVPIFQVVLGGKPEGNAASLGLSVGKIAAKDAPAVVRKLTALYEAERNGAEGFTECTERLGKARMKQELAEFERLPEYDEHPEYYRDNRQEWDYFVSTGVGECAGEVVDQAEFLLEDADRMEFEASLHLEAGRLGEAAGTALQAMKKAADGLLFTRGLLLSDRYDTVEEFRKHFGENGGAAPQAAPQFIPKFIPMIREYFFRAVQEGSENLSAEKAHQRVEEATLFIEEAHGVYSRMGGALA